MPRGTMEAGAHDSPTTGSQPASTHALQQDTQ
eukprot:CAMPEP_0202881220 /NCGR_PEP_ID=MMETSP1391-20130828/36223_1 /ASSEMBLY_ACC=CAM_ASM_000867 /TAXON_ID=1034604 /ORGANISM="Chlamydomonas leiostraca, Strain SAG 11-49" /LENGTH=31 /DNA_ID= /DNA_START= /DNA_END= /DNA_ORIENTATION=